MKNYVFKRGTKVVDMGEYEDNIDAVNHAIDLFVSGKDHVNVYEVDYLNDKWEFGNEKYVGKYNGLETEFAD